MYIYINNIEIARPIETSLFVRFSFATLCDSRISDIGTHVFVDYMALTRLS